MLLPGHLGGRPLSRPIAKRFETATLCASAASLQFAKALFGRPRAQPGDPVRFVHEPPSHLRAEIETEARVVEHFGSGPSSSRESARKRAAWIGLPLAVVGAALMFVACGTERPNAAPGTTDEPEPFASSCATPNEGCECIEPGKQVECGVVKHSSADGFVACSMGHRTCIGGRWGTCIGETDVVRPRTFTAGGGPIGTRALGAGAPCGSPGGGPSNPCDPYCNAFVDDPVGLVLDGGLVVADGGLTIPPNATPDGGAPAAFQSTPGGVSNCGGVTNIVGPACTPPGLTTCQQDFHCDTLTNTCLWNGGAGYFNPNAGGADLTVGAPCGPAGSGNATAPVCNRGSVAVPGGTVLTFHVLAVATPPDGCSNLGPPTYTRTLGGDLVPGACTNFTLGNSTGNKMITINAGNPGATPEGPGLCANNSAAFKDDGAPSCGTCSACNTVLTGKVYDPSGASPTLKANNVPLAGVTVFQPAGALRTLTDGVQCDNCTNLATPSVTETVTDASGSFTLSNVSPGTAVPIVVQSGRWRRAITMNVPACTTTAVPNGTLRMPKNRTDGLGGVANIPKIAIVMGDRESLECGILKYGIDPSEFARRTGPGDANRIQFYRSGGMTTAAGLPPSGTNLWGAGGSINEYAAVVLPCSINMKEASGAFASATEKTTMRNWTAAGGRLFIDHWGGEAWIHNGGGAFGTTSSWANPLPGSALAFAQAKVLTTTPVQTLYRDWLFNVGASTDWGSGYARSDEPWRHALNPNATQTTQWLRGEQNNNWGANPGGDYALSYSFETPIGAAAGATCGRVIYNGMHVAQPRIPSSAYPTSSHTFPTSCDLSFGLTSEEKALEYQFFQLTACQLGGSVPPPPPPPPLPLPVVNYQRDYLGVCGPGERVKWGPLYWQSVIPPGTSVDFRAATASTIAALPPSPPAAAPTTAAVGKAASTVLAPAWDCQGCPGSPVSVDSQLITQTGTPSKEYLRVYMTFNPTASIPPTLLSWRQIYDCVPAE